MYASPQTPTRPIHTTRHRVLFWVWGLLVWVSRVFGGRGSVVLDGFVGVWSLPSGGLDSDHWTPRPPAQAMTFRPQTSQTPAQNTQTPHARHPCHPTLRPQASGAGGLSKPCTDRKHPQDSRPLKPASPNFQILPEAPRPIETLTHSQTPGAQTRLPNTPDTIRHTSHPPPGP